MRTTGRWKALACAALAAAALAAGAACATGKAAGQAVTNTTPTPAQVAALREVLGRVADGLNTGGQILSAAGALAKDADLDRITVAALGVPGAPGPLTKAVASLKTVNDEPGAKAIVRPILAMLDPAVQKLEAKPDKGLAQLGLALAVALQFAKTWAAAPAPAAVGGAR